MRFEKNLGIRSKGVSGLRSVVGAPVGPFPSPLVMKAPSNVLAGSEANLCTSWNDLKLL